MSVAEAGTQARNIVAGLPNITGGIGLATQAYGYDATNPDGAFYTEQVAETTGYGDSNVHVRTMFDASRSNAIYCNGKTVQPLAIALIPQLRY